MKKPKKLSKRITKRILLIVVFCFAFVLQQPGLESGQARVKIDSTDPELWLSWYKAHEVMRENTMFKDLKWEYIGPDVISGRVNDVAVHRADKHTIYVGAASGGVWKTVNSGTTWEPILEHALMTSVGDIAVAPSNPDIVWAGLGASNMTRSSQAGSGVYKSTDAGKTWEHKGLTDTHSIGRIVIHPQNPDIVYVAASGHIWTDNEERGVYKTTDGGSTWTKVLYVDEKSGAIDLAMDPSDGQTLYAATWQRIRRRWSDPQNKPDYSGSGIHKTTDGGKTWRKINNGLPQAKDRGRIGLDVSSSNPDVVYAIVDNQSRRTPEKPRRRSWAREAEGRKPLMKGIEVYISDDKGENWKNAYLSKEPLSKIYAYPDFNWLDHYFGQIRVDPNDENTVYIIGVNVLKSVDGGKTFTKLSYPGLHADHHALWIDPDNSNYLVNGNDGGLNISYDGGKTWMNFHSNLGIQQFYSVAVDMEKPFNVYASPQDHGCVRGPVTSQPGKARPGQDYRLQWERAPGGEYTYVAIDPTDSNIYYANNILKSKFRDGEWESETIQPADPQGETRLRRQCLNPFLLSSHNPSILYIGTQFLHRTLDRGTTWETISPDLTAFNPEQQDDVSFAAISVISESPLKFGLLYVGTDDGKVQVTRDHGNHWTEIGSGLPFNKHVSRVIASAYDEGTVYLSLNGKRDDDFAAYLYKSTDYGETWIDISSNIPCGPINVIREDPKNADVLYVGTDLSVYVSTDGGKNWHVLGSGLPTTFVHDLVVHPRDSILVAATHGRGIYILDVSSVQKM